MGRAEAEGQELRLTLIGSNPPAAYPLAGTTLVGRASDVGLRLEAPGVSRRHARVHTDDDGVWLEDLGSRNGTYVNGVRVARPTPLRPGDIVGVGTAHLRLETGGERSYVSFDIARQEGGEIWNVGGDVHRSTVVRVGEEDPWDELFVGSGPGRVLMALGLVAVLVGFGLWVAFIFGVASGGFEDPSSNPFTDGPRVVGISQPILGFALFLGGGVVAGIGSGLSRAARRRRGDVVGPVRRPHSKRRAW